MPQVANLVHETSTTTGTGNFTTAAVNGKVRGSTAFGTADLGAENPVIFISHRTAAEWEIVPVYWSDANTMVRGTPLASSNAGAAVNFAAGTKDIVNDIPAAITVPASLGLNQSDWGDVVLSWTDAVNWRWEVQADFGSGFVHVGYTETPYLDIPVETSIPLVNNLTTWDGTTTWGFDLRVRGVDASGNGGPWSSTFTSAATVDDSFVTDYILGFGHSAIESHFNTDDGYASGASRDLVSWSTLRAKYAHEKGLRLVAVSPINASSPGSSIEEQAQGDVTDTNYWYDLDTPANGPLLTALDALVAGKESLIKAAFVAWGGPDIDAIETPDGAASPLPTFLRMQQGMIATFAAIRTIVSNDQLPIYFQVASRIYANDDPDTLIQEGFYPLLIGIEEGLAFSDPYTMIGAPSSAEGLADFITTEGSPGDPARHLTPAANHRAAYRIGAAMARGSGDEQHAIQFRGDTTQLLENYDLDELTTGGFYNVLDPTNGPGGGFAWYLQVLRWDQTQSQTARQFMMSGTAGWWQRVGWPGAWDPWVQVAGGEDAPLPVAVGGTGAGDGPTAATNLGAGLGAQTATALGMNLP